MSSFFSFLFFSRKNVKEWIKGQFRFYFLLNFVLVDFCSQLIFFWCFLVRFQPLKDNNTERYITNQHHFIITVRKLQCVSFFTVFPEGWSAHIWMLLLRLPKALAPTLVGTKLLFPIPPDRLRKSARRWVTQVAVLQARFCAVTLLQENKWEVNAAILLQHRPHR